MRSKYLIDYLKTSEFFSRLVKLFPSMVEASKEIEVIPWKEEFNIADSNPEVIDVIEYYQSLLEQNLITEEQYRSCVNEVLTGYASRTEGIVFIEEKKVSFRKGIPNFWVAIHELGHIYFQEPDPIWSAAYGGGEILVELALLRSFYITEEEVRRYHWLLKQAEVMPEVISRELTKQIASRVKFDCYPHLYAFQLYSGTVPNDLISQIKKLDLGYLLSELNSPEWGKVKVSSSGIRQFLINVVEGLKWNDSFSLTYAEAIEIIRRCPVCEKVLCICN